MYIILCEEHVIIHQSAVLIHHNKIVWSKERTLFDMVNAINLSAIS